MSLHYENATSGNNAINDIQKMLRSFGCQRFATGFFGPEEAPNG